MAVLAAVETLGVFLPKLLFKFDLLGWRPAAVFLVKLAAAFAPLDGDFEPAHILTLQIFQRVISFFFLVELDETVGALSVNFLWLTLGFTLHSPNLPKVSSNSRWRTFLDRLPTNKLINYYNNCSVNY
jgi:hypothetical protein